jgi:hypothetical protein
MKPIFRKQKLWEWFSPWMIIGSVCILAAILIFLAVKNTSAIQVVDRIERRRGE